MAAAVARGSWCRMFARPIAAAAFLCAWRRHHCRPVCRIRPGTTNDRGLVWAATGAEPGSHRGCGAAGERCAGRCRAWGLQDEQQQGGSPLGVEGPLGLTSGERLKISNLNACGWISTRRILRRATNQAPEVTTSASLPQELAVDVDTSRLVPHGAGVLPTQLDDC